MTNGDDTTDTTATLTLEQLVGHLISVTRPTFLTRDCECNAKNRLARADHSPLCPYSKETGGFIGVLWRVRHLSVEDIPIIELETTEGLGWAFEPDRDEVDVLDALPLEAFGHRIARLEMIARAAEELIRARKRLVGQMGKAADEGSVAVPDPLSHPDVVKAAARAEAAIDRLAQILDPA